MEATTMFAVSDAEVISYVNLFTSNGGFVGIYDQHRSSALEAYKSGKRYVMRGIMRIWGFDNPCLPDIQWDVHFAGIGIV
jgi:hypothetical protein